MHLEKKADESRAYWKPGCAFCCALLFPEPVGPCRRLHPLHHKVTVGPEWGLMQSGRGRLPRQSHFSSVLCIWTLSCLLEGETALHLTLPATATLPAPIFLSFLLPPTISPPTPTTYTQIVSVAGFFTLHCLFTLLSHWVQTESWAADGMHPDCPLD